MSFVSQPVSFLFHPNSHALQVVLCQINIFCHRETQNMMSNFRQIYEEQFALIFVNLMQISHHILGLLVIKYIDLKKNNLFHFYLHFGNRFLTIVTNVLCKSDENRSSYFGLIGEKIC